MNSMISGNPISEENVIDTIADNDSSASEKKAKVLNPSEILSSIKAADSNALGKLGDRQALRVVRLTLEQIARQVESVEQGSMKVPGLGNFRVRQMTREREGQPTTSVRRVRFTAAVSAPKGAARVKGKRKNKAQAEV